MNIRLLAIPLAAAAVATVAIVATQSGADFSGTSNTGTIGGTFASVSVVGYAGDGNGMNIEFPKVLVPNEAQSVTTDFSNNGNISEDIYVVFPTTEALHALNQQGRYAGVSIAVDGGSPFWQSSNLNDGLHTGATPAGPYDCNTPTNSGTPQICPLPPVVKLATNVGQGQAHSWTFTYEPQDVAGHPPFSNAYQTTGFNPYPVNAAGSIVPSEIAGHGLPYQFVAVPTGHAAPVVAVGTGTLAS